MKKLSLVLALILVFTCFAFVACGDDTDTSSDAGSSAAESSATSDASSEAASSDDASSEATSSDDASSDDASSDDASSEDESGDESGDVSGDESGDESEGEDTPAVPNVVPTGKNVALNKSYTGADPAITGPAAAPSTYAANLTDGTVSDLAEFKPDWFGFWYNKDATIVSNNAPDGVATIELDLGSKVSNINTVRIHVWNANNAGVVAAESIEVLVSEDGSSYTSVGNLTIPETDDPAWADLAVSNVSAQYVKFVVNVGGTWTFMNEIEVYA